MKSEDLELDTSDADLIDITRPVEAFVDGSADGLCCVFVPHATAGVALFETGAGTEPDVTEMLDRLLPRDDRYVHKHGSPGPGSDHVLPVIVGPSIIIPVADGRLEMGTWQSIVIVDRNRDNPRRTVQLRLLED